MLYGLEIENFYSIREAQVIDLTTGYSMPNEPERLAPMFSGAEKRVPKVIALFGANASGKSNVLRALSFLQWFTVNSFQIGPDAALPYLSFLNVETQDKPTRLAASFSGPAELDSLNVQEPQKDVKLCKYEYELVLNGSSKNPKEVISETLKYWPSGRPVRLFARDNTGAVEAHNNFALSDYKGPLKSLLRPNASVISTLAQLKQPMATYFWTAAAHTILSNIWIQKTEYSDDSVTRLYWDNPELLKALNRDIERIDFGIREMRFPANQNVPVSTVFEHTGLSKPITLGLESHGTRQFIKIFPLIFKALQTGGIAIIDELELALHPLILPEILGWFYDQERNPYNAQLWMTCQSPSLMRNLIKEEIVFCEKDLDGRTSVYGMCNIMDVRRDDNYYQKYLGGVYGAVPQIG